MGSFKELSQAFLACVNDDVSTLCVWKLNRIEKSKE